MTTLVRDIAFSALLPLKGHSERVPGKNLRPMGERPLFHHVGRLLDRCEWIDEILIDTDSDEIAESARRALRKATLLERPESLCGNHVPMDDVLRHDIGFARNEHLIQAHATCPLMTEQTLLGAIRTYLDNLGQHDSLFTVTPLHQRLYTERGEPLNPNRDKVRTQDFAPIYLRNACLYLFSKSSFLATGNRIGDTPLPYPMNKLDSIDIDDEDDFSLATLVYEHRQRENRSGEH